MLLSLPISSFLNKVMFALLKFKTLNSVVCLAAFFQGFELTTSVSDVKAVDDLCVLYQFLVCE